MRDIEIRAGTRFVCKGDGLCCSDAHLLGPVSRAEARAIRMRVPNSLTTRPMLALRVVEGGTCTFLDRSTSRCAIHHLPELPRTCSRYPFVLIETPDGLRLATDHRCPCRTMGVRPSLSLEAVYPSLLDRKGRLSLDRVVEERIAISASTDVPWSEWRTIEARLLAGLDSSEPTRVLSSAPWAVLERDVWLRYGRALAATDHPSRWMKAAEWVGEAIAVALDDASFSDRARPWSDAFERAQARSESGSPDAILNDWVADQIWSLEWTELGSFELLRVELSSRIEIARVLANHFEELGGRTDRAMAEAVSVIEIFGLSDAWRSMIATLGDELRSCSLSPLP